MNNKSREFVKRNFTPEEIVEKANDLANENQRKRRLENDKKSAMSSYKSQIDEVDARISQLSQDITNGYCNEWMMCEVEMNAPNPGFKTIRHPITNEVVRVVPMEEDDFQTKMPFAECVEIVDTPPAALPAPEDEEPEESEDDTDPDFDEEEPSEDVND